MTSSPDSSPVWEARALAIGLSAAIITSFKTAGIDTMSKLAFGCAFQPSSSDETPLIELFKLILSRDATLNETAMLRRLYYESHASMVQDMRTRVDRSDTDGPKKLPPAERAARHAIQQQRLSGIVIADDLEPSFNLLDRVCQQYDLDQLSYLGPEECGSRAQEVVGIKKDPSLKLERDSQGNIKAKEDHPNEQADVASDYKLRQAFTRRSLAYDQANLIGFSIQEAWIAHLFKLMHKDVPAGYSKVSMTQILSADREIFIRMADACRATIIPTLGADRPLDVSMKSLIHDPDVAYLTLPLPVSKSKGKGKGKVANDVPYKKQEGGGGKNGKTKGKGKKGKGTSAPDGCVARLEDGRNICFAFNASRGCSHPNVTAGGRCRFGFHVCGKAGCRGNHSMVSCPTA